MVTMVKEEAEKNLIFPRSGVSQGTLHHVRKILNSTSMSKKSQEILCLFPVYSLIKIYLLLIG